MPLINLYTTYGDYADDYCEDWAPGSYEDYADDYVAEVGMFEGGGQSFSPRRLPAYPTWIMSWDQSVQQTAGASTIACAPYVQELQLQLSWAGMAGADKAALEAFFKSSGIDGMTGQFAYTNPTAGPSLPVRFASGALDAMPEVAYGRYRVNLALRVDLNYPQMTTSGAPPAMTGNRFVIGAVAMQFPVPLRSSAGYEIVKPQTLERNTQGSPVIYNKSSLTLQKHQISLVLDFEAFIRLQAFFFSFVHGARNSFTWCDESETVRTVRLAGSRIIIKQTGYDRYTTEIDLEEEI